MSEPNLNRTDRYSASVRYNPIHLLYNDICLVLSNIALFPAIASPLITSNKRGELYVGSFSNVFNLAIHGVFVAVGLFGFLVLSSWFFLNGALWLILFGAYLSVLVFLSALLNKRMLEGELVESDPAIGNPRKFKDEKWFFVNGIMTGRGGTQNIVDEI